jgi:hypothetical protein
MTGTESTMTNPGRCLCGSVTWEVTAEPQSPSNCHCGMCRKSHCAAFATYWTVAHADLRFTGGATNIVLYKSSASDLLTRAFCGACGSAVPNGDDEAWSVPAGGHDDGPVPDPEIFVASQAP